MKTRKRASGGRKKNASNVKKKRARKSCEENTDEALELAKDVKQEDDTWEASSSWMDLSSLYNSELNESEAAESSFEPKTDITLQNLEAADGTYEEKINPSLWKTEVLEPSFEPNIHLTVWKTEPAESSDEPETAKKRKKVKTCRTYNNAMLKKALQAIKEGMPVSTAAKMHNIPRTTLVAKKRGITLPRIQNPGPECILGEENENHLVRWILHMSSNGFPISRHQLLDSVQLLLNSKKKKTVFKDNRPGRHWYEAFRARHEELSETMSRNLSRCKSAVKEEKLRSWFNEVQIYLESKKLLDVHPSRIFNCDESALFMSPKGNNVLFKKGEKTVYNFISYDEKECLTTLFCANADGNIAPPMVMFSYKRIPGSIAANMPKGWSVGHSDNGWMTGETFFEYIANIFHPWLVKNSIEFPVVLFLDATSSHMTMALSDFCKKNQIELVALYPNATHILQPLDVAFFDPLKKAWTKVVTEWRLENNGERMRRDMFARILQKAIDSLDYRTILKNGFEKTGLHPFSGNKINYQKYFKKSVQLPAVPQTTQEISHVDEVFVARVEDIIGKAVVERFQAVGEDSEWNGETRLEGLFSFWRQIRKNINSGVEIHNTSTNNVSDDINTTADDTVVIRYGEEEDAEEKSSSALVMMF